MIQFLIDMPLQPFKGAAALKTSMGIPPSRSLKGDGGNWAVKLERFALLRKIEKLGAEGGTRTPYFLALFLLGFTTLLTKSAFFLRN